MQVKAFRIACGDFISESDVEKGEMEKEGTALLPEGFPLQENMYAARARGTSMEPFIKHETWVIFASQRIGTREGQIVLVEDRSKIGEDRYTLKKYHSTKNYFPDGT